MNARPQRGALPPPEDAGGDRAPAPRCKACTCAQRLRGERLWPRLLCFQEGWPDSRFSLRAMEILVMQVFVSLLLGAGSVLLFLFTAKQRDFDHADRLALLPMDTPEERGPEGSRGPDAR